MTQQEKQEVISAFVDSCPYHNLRRGTCSDGLGGMICDGNCKYCHKFIGLIESMDKESV